MNLRVLYCRVNNDVNTLFPFYARDSEEAERKAGEILEEYQYERLDLKEFPGGFRMARTHIPGVMEEGAI